jgi:hypothetical protein
MDIEFLAIADAAEVVNQKLYVLGGCWTVWHSPVYPAPARLAIAVGIEVGWDETNQRQPVHISIVDADGNGIVPDISAQVEVGRPPGIAAGVTQRALLAINAGLQLPRPGRYEVRVAVGQNGAQRTVSFEAVLVGGPAVQIQ